MEVFEGLVFAMISLLNFSVHLLSVQLRMFDLNGDGKLGLSEMARWVPSVLLSGCEDLNLS